jgi:hypothetical protein
MKKAADFILATLLLLPNLLSACTPAAPAGGEPATTIPAITATALPSATATPAASPTATPAPVQIDLPVTQIAFEKWIEPNPDGTFTSYFWEDYPDDGVFNAPESPSYIWNINPYSGLPIDHIIVQFDVYATQGEQVIGFDRGVLVELYNMNTIMDGSQHDLNVITPMGVIRYPNFGEMMDRYYHVQTSAGGERHYTVTIPYEQFLGGKTSLAVQFLPGSVYSEPVVAVEGIALERDAVIQALAADDKPQPQAASWLDNYWSGACSLSYAPQMDMPRCFDLGFDGQPCQILAAEFGLEDVAQSDVVLYPGAVETTMTCDFAADDDVAIMRNHMIDPQTGLIHGVWDYDAPPGEQLVATDRVTSNLLIVSGYGYGNKWDMIEYHDPQNEAFLQDILIQAIDQEIVPAPNGKWFYAPGGIDANGEMTIVLDDLSIMIQEIYKELRQTDLERADHLLEGYANTLQLVLEAQELTPANLVPDEIGVKFAPDGSHTFTYNGDFDMGNRFYYFWMRNYEWYGNNLQAQIDNQDLFDAGKLDFFSEMTGEKRDIQFRRLYQDTRRYDSVQRIPLYIYKIFYNLYTGSDGNYTQYYSITDGTPIYKTYGSEVAPWEEFRQHYGSIRSLVTWVQLAAFFNDDSMLSETYPNLIKSMSIVQTDLFEHDFPAGVNPRVWLAKQGLGKRDVTYYTNLWCNEGMRVLRGTNNAPWGMNGALAWRITFDERIADIEQQYEVDFASLFTPEP